MFECTLKVIYVKNSAFERLAFCGILESSFAVALLLYTDWMMVKIASNQRGGNSVTVAHKIPARMLVASKAVFLENYLAVSTLILNGSSIECHEKKHQPFSLSGVRCGSRAIQISG